MVCSYLYPWLDLYVVTVQNVILIVRLGQVQSKIKLMQVVSPIIALGEG